MCYSWTLALFVVTLAAGSTSGALPPESELPRSPQQRRNRLPPESALPATISPAAPLTPAEAVDRKPAELPGEAVLPPQTGTPAESPTVELPLAGSPDGVPWLRLNLRGHTAPIRAAEFAGAGGRLCTAGDDKSVVVWSRDEMRAGAWQYERTIRWQIQRGTRGRIYAIASSPGLLGIAGEGAMGGTGEVVLVDPASGDYVSTLFDELQGHRQVVVALNFAETPSGPVLASQSMDGRTLLWSTTKEGVWRARVAMRDDRAEGTTSQLAARLLAGRGFSAVIALDNQRLLVPVYDRTQGGRIHWRIELVDLAKGSRSPLGGPSGRLHQNAVTSMAIDARRTKLVSADGAGRVYVWDLSASPALVRRLDRPRSAPALSLAMSRDGVTLAIGTAISAGTGTATVEVWNLSEVQRPRKQSTFAAEGHVLACAIDGDSREVVFTSGESVIVRKLTANSSVQRLRGATERPQRVAFSREEPLYRIGIGTKGDSEKRVAIDRVFDTDQLRLTRGIQQTNAEWLPVDWGGGSWSVAEFTDHQGQHAWAFEQSGARRGRLAIAEERDGAVRTVCWIPGSDLANPPVAAVGTSAGGIVVFRVTADGEAPILRRFRGHSSEVTSLAVSRDLRWLVSGSADATVRVWPLGRVAEDTGDINRWGATFQPDDERRLVISSIREDGPLYFRGARAGDEVMSAQWIEGNQRRIVDEPAALRLALVEAPWDRVTEFELRTGRQAPRRFQILPAWQQIVSLVMDEHGEWAYWAPSGYYDASFEGHRLFGWQINRGLDELPDFFLAAQFRATLERPAVMSQLLRAGTVEAAFRAAQRGAPANSAQTIANTYRLKPEVTIVSHSPHVDLAEAAHGHRLRARIRVPAGQSLIPPKAFANGVVAPPGVLVEREMDGGDSLLLYEWQLAVPSDPRVLLQVIAATDQEIADSDQVVLANSVTRPARKPRMFLFAVGIDKYRDAQIPMLRTPVARATELAELMRSRGNGLYQVESTSLLGERATRPAWTFLTGYSADRLREDVSPDDLLVIYLSGHGVQDAAGDRYYYVAADAEYSEIMAGGYADCLSFEDFSHFADISCRKLVILDTCHGGAIQPMRHRELKAAVRTLQQDLLLTLAASDGAEEAVEGRFSTRLVEALEGAADRDGGNRDGVVRLDEVIAYVQRHVAADSLRDAYLQTPSAGPIDLLPFAAPPMSIAVPGDALGLRDRQLR